jgi:hypothetical protein
MVTLTEQEYIRLQQTVMQLSRNLAEMRRRNTLHMTTDQEPVSKRLYGILSKFQPIDEKSILYEALVSKHILK